MTQIFEKTHTKPHSFKDIARDWKLEASPQFGMVLDVMPLTGLRLSNTYFIDNTHKKTV